jgi:hypothetical protein
MVIHMYKSCSKFATRGKAIFDSTGKRRKKTYGIFVSGRGEDQKAKPPRLHDSAAGFRGLAHKSRLRDSEETRPSDYPAAKRSVKEMKKSRTRANKPVVQQPVSHVETAPTPRIFNTSLSDQLLRFLK